MLTRLTRVGFFNGAPLPSSSNGEERGLYLERMMSQATQTGDYNRLERQAKNQRGFFKKINSRRTIPAFSGEQHPASYYLHGKGSLKSCLSVEAHLAWVDGSLVRKVYGTMLFFEFHSLYLVAPNS